MSAFLTMAIAGLGARFTALAGMTLDCRLDYGERMRFHDALVARAVLENAHHNECSVNRLMAIADDKMPLTNFLSREPFERIQSRANAGHALSFLKTCDLIIDYHYFYGVNTDFHMIIDNPTVSWDSHEALKPRKANAA